MLISSIKNNFFFYFPLSKSLAFPFSLQWYFMVKTCCSVTVLQSLSLLEVMNTFTGWEKNTITY